MGCAKGSYRAPRLSLVNRLSLKTTSNSFPLFYFSCHEVFPVRRVIFPLTWDRAGAPGFDI